MNLIEKKVSQTKMFPGQPQLRREREVTPLERAIRRFPTGTHTLGNMQVTLAQTLGYTPTLEEIVRTIQQIYPYSGSSQPLMAPSARVVITMATFPRNEDDKYYFIEQIQTLPSAQPATIGSPRRLPVVQTRGREAPAFRLPTHPGGSPVIQMPTYPGGMPIVQLPTPPAPEPRTPEESDIPSRRYLIFRDASSLLQSQQIARFMVDPENQEEVPPGLTRVTLIGIDGREYDVIARYDPVSNQIFPPY